MHKQRLELDWVGKDDEPKLEPRILLEDESMSFGDRTAENLLIQGDNLLALKALEQDFSGKFQCVYIDPPFNTQQAFEHYDDGLEHSLWLSLMKNRLKLIHQLMHPTGTLYVHIDDNELGYLIVLLDEIFGRNNRLYIVSFKQSSVSGPKSINPGLVTTSNFILLYAKNKEHWKNKKLFVPTGRDDRYSRFIENFEKDVSQWKLRPLKDAFAESVGVPTKDLKKHFADKLETELESFVLANSARVARTARIAPKDVAQSAKDALAKSQKKPDQVFVAPREGKESQYFCNGEQLIFYSSKVKEIDGKLTTAQALSTIWDDLLSNNLHKEGGVTFPNGKKPEALIKRCLEMATDEGDWVLDSFAGSGSTAAVAHKMKRKWVTIELGAHAESLVLPRLRSVVSGSDESGITKAVKWTGGGGFKFIRLAPSLLQKDSYGNWIISPKYNAIQLAEAVCKHEGFKFWPDQNLYWKQGYSTEKDFIFVTTEFLTADRIERIAASMKPDETLLICAKAFRVPANKYPNITIKKIPQMLLGRCEFGRDDYSLNVKEPVQEEMGLDEADI